MYRPVNCSVTLFHCAAFVHSVVQNILCFRQFLIRDCILQCCSTEVPWSPAQAELRAGGTGLGPLHSSRDTCSSPLLLTTGLSICSHACIVSSSRVLSELYLGHSGLFIMVDQIYTLISLNIQNRQISCAFGRFG